MDERYGEGFQNDNKGEQDMSSVEEDVKQLNAEIENFKQVIRDASAAQESAEKDLDEILGSLPQ